MKNLKYLGIAALIFGVLFATAYFIKTNSKEIVDYKTESSIAANIEKNRGYRKGNSEDEVEIKPQISGIIDKIFVEEGDKVAMGDLLAKLGSPQ